MIGIDPEIQKIWIKDDPLLGEFCIQDELRVQIRINLH